MSATRARSLSCRAEESVASWEVARSRPGDEVAADDAAALDWIPAEVPGTVAGAYRSAGRAIPADLDADDWWFRASIAVDAASTDERIVLACDGVATISETYVDGFLVAHGESMFERQEADITDRAGRQIEILVCCRSLSERFGERRSPRARWRTRIAAADLRWHRTTLLGRAPGFAAAPAPVGPWRPVRVERRRLLSVSRAEVRPTVEGSEGVLNVVVGGHWFAATPPATGRLVLDGPSGHHETAVEVEWDGDELSAGARLVVPAVAKWFPHSHGDPVLHTVVMLLDTPEEQVRIDLGAVGFRVLAPGPSPAHDLARDGLDLHINGVSIFARGFVWSAVDLVNLSEERGELRRMLTLVRDAGANMVRLPGTGTYAPTAFYDLCDELGILVWQDLMFANFHYPFGDESFLAAARAEVRAELQAVLGRPSLVVVCGGSEVEQQAAMFGVDIKVTREPFFDELVPQLMDGLGCDALYVPSSPWGGALPFRFSQGVAHYFGVGGYRRPVNDVKSAGVRFASECLAFGNVPEPEGMPEIFSPGTESSVTHPEWKAGVPRDVGTGWDFDDVRDHYLQELYGIDPVALRSADQSRYLELSRRVPGEVMREVFAEWRRSGSGCGGGLVLWLRDLVPGAGWGVLDSAGRPKATLHLLKGLFAPVAVWTTDEGLSGIRVHVANDRATTLVATLCVVLYRRAERPVEEVESLIEVGPHTTIERDLEQMLGRFVDAAAAYGFGPAQHDLIVATLEHVGDLGGEPISQHVRLIGNRSVAALPNAQVGLAVETANATPDGVALTLRSRALALGVRVHMAGFEPSDQVFDIAPGHTRTIVLTPSDAESLNSIEVSADNVEGRITVDPSSFLVGGGS